MASYNRVLLMGNLTRNPELTYTPSQMPICKFGLAVSRKFKTRAGEDREDVLFVDCTAFDKKAEVIHQYCTKGKPIFVEGQLKMDTWDDKTTGQKRSKLYVIVDNFQFIGGRDGGAPAEGGGEYDDHAGAVSERGPSGPTTRPPPPGTSRVPGQRPAQPPPFTDDSQIKEEDIPF